MDTNKLIPKFGLTEPILEAILKGQEENVDNLLDTQLWKACIQEEIKKENKPIAILSFDTDKIKEYVFASPKLPEIRGGSKLIEEALDDDAIWKIIKQHGLSRECIIFASGGGGMLIMPSDKAETVGKAIEGSFVKKTLGATVTWACLNIHPMDLLYGYNCLNFNFSEAKALADKSKDIRDYFGCRNADRLTLKKWMKRKCFGELVAVLSAKLQKKKGERSRYPFFETIPYAGRCSSCGMRPVVEVKKKYEKYQGDINLCDVCWTKKNKGLIDRREGDDWDDLKSIGEASNGRAKGYVGVIYADGNGMGKVFQKLKSIEQYRKWSQEVDFAFDQNISDLLDTFNIEKYEKLVTGGDDIILFLPADKTLMFVLKLVETIQKNLQDIAQKLNLPQLSDKMGLSAGVVLAHHNYPALYLVDYVEQLLKTAKKHGKRDKDNPQSAIDFAVLTDSSPLNTEISKFRKGLYIRKEDVGKLRQRELNLISRPFTLEAFERFMKKAQALKAYVPRSQIYIVREFVQNHPKEVADINFMYQVARSRPGTSWRGWIEKTTAAKSWSMHPDLRELIWKQNQKDRFTTFFVDYTEVYHFI